MNKTITHKGVKIRVGQRISTHDGPGEILGFGISDYNEMRYAEVKLDDERKGTRKISLDGVRTMILVAGKRY